MNAEISYPREILRKKPGTLEKLLVGIGQGKPPAYKDFPDTLSSTQLDPYLTWLSSLTAADPSHNERGSYVYYDPAQRNIVYSQTPSQGFYESASETKGVFIKHPDDNTAVIVNSAHTHPRATSFSTMEQHGGDLSLFAIGVKVDGKVIHLPTMSVGTPGDNYLLIHSSESPQLTWEEFAHVITKGYATTPRWKLERYGEALCKKLPQTRLARWTLWENVGTILGGTYEGGWGVFSGRLNDACHLAEATKSAFYYSGKDGVYHRITSDNLEEYIKTKINAVVDKMRERMLADSQPN